MNPEYANFICVQKEKIFSQILFEWKTRQEILDLYELGYSPLQVSQIYEHEVGFNSFLSEKVTYKHKTFFIFPKFGLNIFSVRLRKVIPYSQEFHRFHLSKPQWWKIRCAHLDKTEDEVKEIAKNQLLDWQKNTCKTRKASSTYNPIYTIDYWAKISDNPKESLEKYKREISPRCVEFWLKKGYDVNEAKKKISNICREGAIATLNSLQGKNKSKLEIRIHELLNDNSIQQQLFLGRYSYDLYCRESKKIVEINGTYWHADARVFKNEDEMLVHGTARELREKDERKISYAKSLGWDVMIVWELDYCKSPNDVLESIKRFFKNE